MSVDNIEHSRNHENRDDQNRGDFDREGRNKENQNRRIEDIDSKDLEPDNQQDIQQDPHSKIKKDEVPSKNTMNSTWYDEIFIEENRIAELRARI